LITPQDILTRKELANRLKVSESWVFEKTRARCEDPIPCLRIGHYVRFNWPDVSAWLETTSTARAAKRKAA